MKCTEASAAGFERAKTLNYSLSVAPRIGVIVCRWPIAALPFVKTV